jgi:serine/threonine-protein kinase
MAPERFFGAPASTGTDVYELTVVLYAMLVGRLPWTDVTNVQARLNPVSPTAAVSGVPERLSTIVMQGLSTRPERRPAGISELLHAVRDAASTAMDTEPRVTAAARVTAATAVAGADLVITQKSDDAQVIESRRDGSGARPAWPWIVAGIALLAGAVVAGAVAMSSPAAEVDVPASSDLAAIAAPTPPATTVLAEPLAEEAPTPAPSTTAEQDPPSTAQPPGAKAGKVAGGPVPLTSPSSAPSAPKPPKGGKPKGAPCTRSSECASMVCAAETCQ